MKLNNFITKQDIWEKSEIKIKFKEIEMNNKINQIKTGKI